MNSLYERVGASLRRNPWILLIATLFGLGSIASTTISRSPDTSSRTWVTWVALGLIGYGVIVTVVLFPRIRWRDGVSEDTVATLRWTFGIAPACIGFGAVWAGAERWVVAGLLVSALLLIFAATAQARRQP